MSNWLFADPPNVAAITTREVLSGTERICYVTHDSDDGAWQFHGDNTSTSEDDAAVVALRTIVDLDPSIAELADLPLGWCARRVANGSAWERMPIE